ncbi:chitobiase/beta-hexosaminidase C-terminal domain-containing protein [Fulvivirgaceae bacterium BMA10]|uniref:Chitobiase/beta-hexosaminidase C-terminal domain-containing protein n=1 Tax=Splendidivirga corallicola TaxID=3051826 RepID=A0ABT8KME9_9BACT|nr:chitobiase/beta-hexosaminidase C-terminal domain-containing protein [Fulvivirgaceae bacterium BMA10]
MLNTRYFSWHWVLALFIIMACENEKEPQSSWEPVKGHIMSKWAKEVDPAQVWQEYPRPGLVRSAWLNLNGLWDYAINKESENQPTEYDGSILVPFPVESALSGVKKTVGSEKRLWYRRSFEVPDQWDGQEILLHFEAVDWEAKVWLNDDEIGEHRGGYDPFYFNITRYLKPGKNELIVRVFDPTDDGTQPIGKQTKNPQGIYYTAVTGIWQTVWLEAVPETHIQHFKLTTDIEKGEVAINTMVSNGSTKDLKVKAEIFANDMAIASATAELDHPLSFQIPSPNLWTPDNPFLYDLKLTLVENDQEVDHIKSYFGMRKISLGKDEKGFTRILLNNEFVFQNGPLDQGFWPGGIYTAPSMEAMKYDLEITKSLGFNMLRKHVKIEPRSFYYLCDKMGLLVWQDMPNGDKKIGPSDPDIVRSEASAKQFEYELSEMISHLYNHPSIVMWVPFNEGWGQYETARIVDWVKEQDPTRLVNNASGWTDRGVGDVNDMHHYPDPSSPEPEENRAIVLGEFGGLGLFTDGHMWQTDNWGYRNLASEEELITKYEQYYDRVWSLMNETGLSASVYTQITDVEGEANGLLTYDREVLKVDEQATFNINTNQFLRSPTFEPSGGLFNKGDQLTIGALNGKEIRYTLDGTEPEANSLKYTSPIELLENVVVKAKSFGDDEESRTITATYTLTKIKRPIYKFAYSERYRAAGDFALLDEETGSTSYADGKWQGFHGDDLEVIIDLGEVKNINKISMNFLEDTKAWIFLPQGVEVSLSKDNQSYHDIHQSNFDIPNTNTEVNIEKVNMTPDIKEARYIKVRAINVGKCPEWHDGAGGKAWIFIDEVAVR